LANLVDITVFLTDMTHYKRMNEAYNLYFNLTTGPTRTCVAVKELPHKNLLVEIKGVAALPK
jgi:2-aminomuconate deaminase